MPLISLRNTMKTQLGSASIALMLALSLFASNAQASSFASRPPEFGVSAAWGQVLTSQLVEDKAVSYWSVAMHAPLVDAIGLQGGIRLDSIVFGDSENALSMAVHPGRTEYNLTLEMMPPKLPIGFEWHHVSSHEVAALHSASTAEFEAQIDEGGASNLLTLVRRDSWGALRLGFGGAWRDTNTGPILLGLDTFLLNSQSASGPLAALRLNVPTPGKFRMRVGALYINDQSNWNPGSPHVASWGAAVSHPVYERMSLAFSYAGNNGTPDLKLADNSIALVLKFDWSLATTGPVGSR